MTQISKLVQVKPYTFAMVVMTTDDFGRTFGVYNTASGLRAARPVITLPLPY